MASRQRILEAAVRLFSEHSFDDVQMVEIAAAAGVAHGLLFHHFGNKRGLYQEAIREISRRLFHVGTPDPALEPHEQIRSIIRNHYLLVAENEDLLIGYARGTTAFVSDVEAITVLEHDRATVGRWALTTLGFNPESKALLSTVNSAASAMFQLSLKWLENGRDWDIESQLIDATIEILAGGLRAASILDPAIDVAAGLKILGR